MTGHAVLAMLAMLQPPAAAPAVVQHPGAMPIRPAVERPDPMASETMRGDARLADVCFTDARRGWAVGDRGTIWHTEDGGRQWYLQDSGVACPLRSVWFISERTGWAAGGASHPYTHTGSGVLLATSDGGRTWRRTADQLLPPLRQVRFFDAKNGWAVGDRSAMFPTGVFVTDSGGQGWRPVSGESGSESTGRWLAGDFLDPNTGTLAGRDGTVAMVQRSGIRSARIGGFGLRNLTRMKLVAPVHGWLIGDGGLVMMTGDLGATWQTPPGMLPPETADQFDFAALAVRGPKCWVAGSPGTRVFHSADAGRNWTTFDTGTQLPIYGLCFADDQHGWAVGALGTILATSDGGRTWQRQRAGGTRAAMLALVGDAADVPLELFVRLSGNEGYLGTVEVLGRRDVEIPCRDKVHPADRVHEAVVAVGGSGARTAWQFPLRQAKLNLSAEQIIATWDRANDSRGLRQLEDHVVRQIRLWRPDVIVTHDAAPQGDDPLGHLINQVVLQAIEKAGDPTSLPAQITAAGLEPWTVKKVYAALPPGRRGSTELTTAQLAARLGRSLADVAATPRGLLASDFSVVPPTLGFRLLVRKLPQQQGRRDFFSGIVLHPGGDARRELTDPPAEGLAMLRQAAARRRNMAAIIEQSKTNPQNMNALLARTDELTRGLDNRAAGRILYQLARQYHDSGRGPLAAETFELLVDRYPQHPLGRSAWLWLVQYYGSGEVAWQVQSEQRYGGQQAQALPVDHASQTGRPAAMPVAPRQFAVRQASALAVDPSQDENRPDRVAELGRQIARTLPALFAEDALRFPLATAQRNQGYPRSAERFYQTRCRGAVHDAWWACARGEQWLMEREGLPPKSVLLCAAAPAKPRLDGLLDDAVWQRAKPAELRSPLGDDAQWPGVAMLTYDREFLYLAVQCRQAPGAKYAATEGPRPRDPDLSAHDRVDVLIDLDRDFATYYRLTVDHRGFTGEACWGDRTWDPEWFVAAKTSKDTWTIEAAIPLEQLTGRLPSTGAVWAVGLQRTVPGVGFQSWTTPAAATVTPEGFGYLIFD
ncbi:MAG: hypothetical protein HQ567_21330 [Candidatus Nealsonbacteria bacterium]|nr:hypothetical protein [Candidatus Nealsonbacteria bacterium]